MHVGIVGAGATGLSAAMDLLSKGHEVTILEASQGHGGLATSFKINGVNLERFYHHIFTSDKDIIDMINYLGLGEKLLWIEPSNSIFINNTLYPFSTPFDLLNFKELSFVSRIKMGLLVLGSRFVNDYSSLEDMSARDWVIKFAGKSVYEKVWEPLLYSKFDVDSENVSAVWLWNKFKLRGSTRSQGISKEMLGYLDGGFAQVYEEMAAKITAKGGNILYGESLKELAVNENGTIKVTTGVGEKNFDKVILTFAPQILKKIKTPFEDAFFSKVDRIKYKANICMILEMNKPLTNYYWTTVADKKLPFVAIVEQTNFILRERYGTNIVYLSRYIDESDPLFKSSEEDIANLFLDSLKKVVPGFKREDITKYHVNRANYTQPVIFKNYSKMMLDLKTPVPNIYMANMSNIYPEDRGQSYSIRLGKQISTVVSEDVLK